MYGALEFLRIHKRQCLLLTAGKHEEQQQKIDVLGMRRYFQKVYIVPRPEDKPQKLEAIVKGLGSRVFKISPWNIIVIGDRLDTEISRGNELGCFTVRVKIPGGRHSGEMPLGARHEVPHLEVEDFNELLSYFPF